MADVSPPGGPPPGGAPNRPHAKKGKLRIQIPQATKLEVIKMPSPVQTFDPADYVFVSQLGGGSIGSVDRVRNRHTGQEYARKKISISEGTEDEREKLRSLILKEVETLAQLDHPKLVKLISGWGSIGEVQLIFEFMDGSLKGFHSQEESIIAHIAEQILMGLHYLRDRRIFHRDLKPANVLRNNDGITKIADFGSSKRLDLGNMNSLLTALGTIHYCSPEVLQRRLRKTDQPDKSDIWSLGILLLEIYMGHFPFTTTDKIEIYNQIMHDFNVPDLPNCSPEFRDFIERCLIRDVASRASVDELLAHHFLQMFH